MIKKNNFYNGIVSEQGKLGEGVVHINEFPVYVPNCIPGDHVEIKIIKVEKRRAYGRLVQLLAAGNDRVVARCAVAVQCGGCQLQHQSALGQLTFKSNLLKSRLGRFIDTESIHFLPMITNDRDWATRNKMQFAFSMGENGLEIGLYAARSHRVINFEYCHVMSKPMNDVLLAVKTWHRSDPVSVFNETTGDGILRHITLRYSYVTGQIMLILTVAQPFNMDSFLNILTSLNGMASIYISIQSNPSDDRVIGDELNHIWGALMIDDVVYGSKCQVSPKSFMQANSMLVNRLYQLVINAIDANDLVLDLYCGTGVMTCALANYFDRVIGVDNNKMAIKDAQNNAVLNNVNVEFICKDVMVYLNDVEPQPMAVVLDPPRQGCSAEVIEQIIHLKPTQLIYVSCFPDTLGRDLRLLLAGGFSIESIQGVDMFRHTAHIEAVVVLEHQQT